MITVVPSLLFGLTAVPVLFQLAVMPDMQDRLQAAPGMSLSQLALTLVTAALFIFSFLYLLVGRLFKRLSHQAQHDALTGLLNRRAMDLALEQQWHMQASARSWPHAGGPRHRPLQAHQRHLRPSRRRPGVGGDGPHSGGPRAVV